MVSDEIRRLERAAKAGDVVAAGELARLARGAQLGPDRVGVAWLVARGLLDADIDIPVAAAAGMLTAGIGLDEVVKVGREARELVASEGDFVIEHAAEGMGALVANDFFDRMIAAEVATGRLSRRDREGPALHRATVATALATFAAALAAERVGRISQYGPSGRRRRRPLGVFQALVLAVPDETHQAQMAAWAQDARARTERSRRSRRPRSDTR